MCKICLYLQGIPIKSEKVASNQTLRNLKFSLSRIHDLVHCCLNLLFGSRDRYVYKTYNPFIKFHLEQYSATWQITLGFDAKTKQTLRVYKGIDRSSRAPKEKVGRKFANAI